MITLWIANLGKYNEGDLVYAELNIPYGHGELEEVLEEIGINEEYEEYFISDYETKLNIDIGEYTPVEQLNEKIKEIKSLTNDIDIINGIIEYKSSYLNDIIDTLKYKDYNIIHGVKHFWQVGLYLAEEVYGFNTDSHLGKYLNYEKLWKDSDIKLLENNKAIEFFY